METDGTLERTSAAGNPTFTKLFTDKTWRIVEPLSQVAREIDRSPAQVALNWVTRRPAVVSTLVGATSVEQLDDNLRSVDFEIPRELAERLEEASRPEPTYPYYFSGPAVGHG